MVIRKLFKFENAHIVRNCTTNRCKKSLHGHSYKVEILLESKYLDNGQMIYDFGLLKRYIKDLIDSFDHSISLWDKDEKEYVEDMKKYSQRWITLPVSPSAEQLSRVIFLMIDLLISKTKMVNGEKEVNLYSVIIHETDSGYAQCFKEDAYSSLMGLINLEKIVFSNQIQREWSTPLLWEKLLNGIIFENQKTL